MSTYIIEQNNNLFCMGVNKERQICDASMKSDKYSCI